MEKTAYLCTVPLKDRLLRRRNSLGLTRKDVADLTDLTERTLVNYEEGSREPKASDLQKIAIALQTTAAYLLGETENPGRDKFDQLREEYKDVDADSILNKPMRASILDRLITPGMTSEDIDRALEENELMIKRLELDLLRAEQQILKKEREKR